MGARRIGLIVLVAVVAAVSPPAAAQTAGLNEIPSQEEVDSAILALKTGAAQVVEMKAPRPAWFTSAVEQRVREQGIAAAPADAPLPGEVGIRPGALMISPFICTMNYIFRSGSTLAIGTAGHCLEGNEPVVLLTAAPTGGNPVLVELGRTLLKRDGGIGRDYGLVQIPVERHPWVFPTIATIGGPCGIYTGGDPTAVAHYGHGLLVGTGGTPRAGQGLELTGSTFRGLDLEWDKDSFAWAGLLNSGDSGSAVRTATVPAVGNLTHGIGIGGLPTPSPLGWGTRITTVTSSGWSLVDSPLCLGVGGSADSGSEQDGGGKGKGNGKEKRPG